MSLALAILSHPLVEGAIRVGGLAILAGTVTGIVSFVYRTRVHDSLPEGVTLILGLGAVAIYLNTRLIFVQFIGETGDPLRTSEALLNVSVFVGAGVASYGGRYVGDKAGRMKRFKWASLDPDISPIVRATGRFITVTLPEDAAEIDDIEGYDPVREETKETIAGQTLDFPRGLTVTELQSQFTERLKEEHDIGYVDVEITEGGSVEYLAVGQRVAGIGPTLPPKAAAVAVRADPPFSATPRDTVQLWRTDDDGVEKRIGTGELRASVNNVATLAIEESIAEKIEPRVTYRLMTLSADSHPDREFASMLRRSDETLSMIEITAESPLVGNTVGSIDATVIAVRSAEDDVETIPRRDRLLKSGDSLFVIGRPETLRKLEMTNGTEAPGDEEILESDVLDDLSLEPDDDTHRKTGPTDVTADDEN